MKESAKVAVMKLIDDAEEQNFYGEITIKFRDGQCYQLVKTQSLMLDDVSQTKK